MNDYPNCRRSLVYCNYSLISNSDNAWAQLASLKVFNSGSRTHAPDCIDVVADVNGKAKMHQLTFENAKQLKEYLREAPMDSRTRFMWLHSHSKSLIWSNNEYLRSISQKNSWASLDICQSMLRTITDTHNIMPEFLNVVRCFQDKTSNVEQVFGGTSWRRFTTESKGAITITHRINGHALREGRDGFRSEVSREQWANWWGRSLVNTSDRCISKL